MGIETKINSLGVPQTKILKFSFSTGGHFEKWPKHAISPNFFTGNMWNLKQMSPLNKMITLAEVLGGGGGCMGGYCSPWTNSPMLLVPDFHGRHRGATPGALLELSLMQVPGNSDVPTLWFLLSPDEIVLVDSCLSFSQKSEDLATWLVAWTAIVPSFWHIAEVSNMMMMDIRDSSPFQPHYMINHSFACRYCVTY